MPCDSSATANKKKKEDGKIWFRITIWLCTKKKSCDSEENLIRCRFVKPRLELINVSAISNSFHLFI